MQLTIENDELIELFVNLKGRLDRLEHKVDEVLSILDFVNDVQSEQCSCDNQEKLIPYSLPVAPTNIAVYGDEHSLIPTPENLYLCGAIPFWELNDDELRRYYSD